MKIFRVPNEQSGVMTYDGDKTAFKIIDVTIPTVQADKFVRFKSLEGIGPARYATMEQLINTTLEFGP